MPCSLTLGEAFQSDTTKLPQSSSENDGDKSGPYIPSLEGSGSSDVGGQENQFLTPQRRRLIGSRTASSQKSNARRSDPNGGRCLLSKEINPACVIQVCHVIPRTLGETTLTSLEWSWGMKYQTLNLDTSKNLCFLTSNFHIMFDKGLWFLLPARDVIDRMDKYTKSQPIADIFSSDKFFCYRIVPTPKMKNVVIYYQEHDDPSPDDPSHYKPLYYPYKELPEIQLHIHPYFAAFDAGRKLNAMERYQDVVDSITFMFDHSRESAYNSLLLCQKLYTSWTSMKPPPDFTRDRRPSSRAPPDPDSDNLSENLYKEGEKLRRSKRNKGSKRSHVLGSGAAGQKDEIAAKTPRTRQCMHIPELEDDHSEPMNQRSSDSDSGGSGSEYEGSLIHQWDIPVWIERNLKTIAKSGGWEMSLFNDDQLDDGTLMPNGSS